MPQTDIQPNEDVQKRLRQIERDILSINTKANTEALNKNLREISEKKSK